MKILKYILSFLFIVWLGSGIIYEINPRWFMSETATEVPENPNEFVGKIAKAFRQANRVAVVVKEANKLQNEDKITFRPPKDKFLASDEDYITTAMRLERMKDDAELLYDFKQKDGISINTIYRISEYGLVSVSYSLHAAKGYLHADYLYLNNRPFSVEVYAHIKKGEQSFPTGKYSVIWQPDGSVFRESGGGKFGMAEYEQCAACYQMAQSYLANYAEVQETERLVQEFQQKSNRIASDSRDYVFYKDLPELMPKRMRRNSLVVGYDSNKKPQKIYLSFDNGKRRHSFAYYLENGNLFFAESSSVALKADGMTADTKTYHTVQKWYIANGKVIRKEENEQMLPDFPLSHQKMAEDIRLSTEVATKRAK